MSDNQPVPPINTATYDFCIKAFRTTRKLLKLNIKLHQDEEAPIDAANMGDIFLFNHFARFETLSRSISSTKPPVHTAVRLPPASFSTAMTGLPSSSIRWARCRMIYPICIPFSGTRDTTRPQTRGISGRWYGQGQTCRRSSR